MPRCPEHVCAFTFIKCFIQSGVTLIKITKPAFLSLLDSGFQALVQTLRNINCKDIILSFKTMFDVSTVLLQNACETMSPFTDV